MLREDEFFNMVGQWVHNGKQPESKKIECFKSNRTVVEVTSRIYCSLGAKDF